VAEGFRIEASWLDAVDRYVHGLQQDVMEAADAAVNSFHENFVDYAKSKPNWVGLADELQVWSEDGRLVVGLQGNEMVSQAEYLEYGDVDNAPDSLFRTANGVSMAAKKTLVSELAARRPMRFSGMTR
jgi:hypothetical protein